MVFIICFEINVYIKGCVDTDGDFLAVDDVIEKACVKYQCKEENDLKILVVIQGGMSLCCCHVASHLANNYNKNIVDHYLLELNWT